MTRLDSVPMFDELAEDYDQVLPMFSRFGEQVLELIDDAEGAELLDVGAGRGAVALAAASRGWHVVAVDASTGMVDRLRKADPEMEVRLMDAHALALPDDSVDVAVAAFLLHCVDDPAQVLAEMARVVRPGGQVVVTVPGPVDDGGRWSRFYEVARDFHPARGAVQVARPIDVDALVGASGLVDPWVGSLEVRLPVPSPRVMWEFQMSHGFVGWFRSLAAADQSELERRCLDELWRMYDEGGIELHRGADVHIARVPR